LTKTGRVIGATDLLGGKPTERPVQFGDVFATLYQNLGMDVSKVTLPDLSGREQSLVADGVSRCRNWLGSFALAAHSPRSSNTSIGAITL